MEKTLHQQAWEQTMIAKYGSLDKAREEMKRRSELSKGVPKRTVFKEDPEKAREAGRLGALKRWGKQDENN